MTSTILSFVACIFLSAPAPEEVREVSGVVRQGADLLLVSDDVPGVLFRCPVPVAISGAHLPDPHSMRREVVPGATLALDPEEVELLADGRVAILSERLHCLVGAEGLIVQYASTMSEFGNRGVEGLAARPGEAGGSVIAVLWEGGQPMAHDLPATIAAVLPQPLPALPPLVMIHDLPAGQISEWVNEIPVPLAMPIPPGGHHFYRAPDLVWHRPAAGEEWGFIVLCSSARFAGAETPDEPGRYNCLQRFSSGGVPVGDPLYLDTVLSPPLALSNWEGMAWLEEGNCLVLVADSKMAAHPFAVVMLPEDWR
jgi:hypothetical protein